MPNVTLPFGLNGGPIVDLAVGPTEARNEARKAKGHQFVLPEIVNALVDTGSGITLIDEWLVAKLELESREDIEIYPVNSSKSHFCPRFDVRLEFTQPERHCVSEAFPVASVNLSSIPGVRAIIGRDILSRCVIVYNGPQKQLIFTF